MALKNLLRNNSNGVTFIPHLESARWQQKRPRLAFQSTGRSTGKRSKNRPLRPLVDHPVDRTQNQRATALWSVDRSVDREQPESNLLSVGRPCGRPAYGAASVHVSVHVGRPLRSTGYLVRSTVRSTDLAWQRQFWSEKHVIFNSKNSLKISKITQK